VSNSKEVEWDSGFKNNCCLNYRRIWYTVDGLFKCILSLQEPAQKFPVSSSGVWARLWLYDSRLSNDLWAVLIDTPIHNRRFLRKIQSLQISNSPKSTFIWMSVKS